MKNALNCFFISPVDGFVFNISFLSVSDVATRYPPSLRVVVQETNLAKLRVGELFIITYKGGTLGREGAHDVIIPDINVSKVCNS